MSNEYSYFGEMRLKKLETLIKWVEDRLSITMPTCKKNCLVRKLAYLDQYQAMARDDRFRIGGEDVDGDE